MNNGMSLVSACLIGACSVAALYSVVDGNLLTAWLNALAVVLNAAVLYRARQSRGAAQGDLWR